MYSTTAALFVHLIRFGHHAQIYGTTYIYTLMFVSVTPSPVRHLQSAYNLPITRQLYQRLVLMGQLIEA